MNLLLLLVESSREPSLGRCSWETSAAQLCWIAGNPGVQHNSNIQFLFHIRKYFLIITAGVLEWFPRFISASQIKRQGGCARLFPAFRPTPWKGQVASAWARVALVNPCRWNQPHPNYFKKNLFQPGSGSSVWAVQLLVLAQSTKQQQEGNKQMVGWKMGWLLSETVLARASLQHTHSPALAWEGFLPFDRGIFCLL